MLGNNNSQRLQASTPYTTPERNNSLFKIPQNRAKTELISRKKMTNDQADSSTLKSPSNSTHNSNSSSSFFTNIPKNQNMLSSSYLIQRSEKSSPEMKRKISHQKEPDSTHSQIDIENLRLRDKTLEASIRKKDDQLMQLNQKLRRAVRHAKSHKLKKEIAEKELNLAKDENLQLKKDIDEKDNVISQLYSEIKTLNESNGNDHNKLIRITNLYRQMEMNMGDQIKRQQDKINSIKNEKDDNIRSILKKITLLQSENDSLKSTLAQYKTTRHFSQEDVKNRSNLLQEKYQYPDLESTNEVEKLREQNALLIAKNQELSNQNESLKMVFESPTKIQSSSFQITKLQEALREKDEQISKLQNEIKVLCMSATPQLNTDDEENEGENENISSRNQSQNQKGSYVSNSSDSLREIQSLKEANQKLKDDLRNQQKLFEIENRELKQQLQSLNGFSSMNVSLTHQLNELQQENSRKRENLGQINTTSFGSDILHHENHFLQKDNNQNQSKLNNSNEISILNSMTNDSLVAEILKLKSQNEALKKEIDKINTQSMISGIDTSSNSTINKNNRSKLIQSINDSFSTNANSYNKINDNGKHNDDDDSDHFENEKDSSYSTFDEDSILRPIKKQQKESSTENTHANFDNVNNGYNKNSSNIESYIEDESMIKIIQGNDELIEIAERIHKNSNSPRSFTSLIEKPTQNSKDEIEEEENMLKNSNENSFAVEEEEEILDAIDQINIDEEEELSNNNNNFDSNEEENLLLDEEEDNLLVNNFDINEENEEENLLFNKTDSNEEDEKSNINNNSNELDEGDEEDNFESTVKKLLGEKDNLSNNDFENEEEDLLNSNNFSVDEEEEMIMDKKKENKEELSNHSNKFNHYSLDEEKVDNNYELTEDENEDHKFDNFNYAIDEEEENDGLFFRERTVENKDLIENISDNLLHSESESEKDNDIKDKLEEEEELKEDEIVHENSFHSSSDSHSKHSHGSNGSNQDLDYFIRPNINSNTILSEDETSLHSNYENGGNNSNINQQFAQVCSGSEQLKAQNSMLHDEINDLQEHFQNIVSIQLHNTQEELNDLQKDSQELRQRSYSLELLQMENSNLKHRVINLEAQNIDLRQTIINNSTVFSNQSHSNFDNSQTNSKNDQKNKENQSNSNVSIKNNSKIGFRSMMDPSDDEIIDDDDSNSIGILKEKTEQMRSVINTIRNASSVSSGDEGKENDIDLNGEDKNKKNSSDSLSLFDYRTVKRENAELKEIINKFDIKGNSKKVDSSDDNDGYNNNQLIDKVQQLELTNAELVQKIEEISQNEIQIVERYEEENQGLRARINHLENQLSEAVEAEAEAREIAIAAKAAAVKATRSTADSSFSDNQNNIEIESPFHSDLSDQFCNGLSPSQREEIPNDLDGYKFQISELQQSLSDMQKENSILEDKLNEQIANASATELKLKQENEVLRKRIFAFQSSFSNQDENDDEENILKYSNGFDDNEEDM